MIPIDDVLRVLREGLLLAVIVSAPAVGAALVVGLVMSSLQAMTQIQDQSLSFVPKLLGVLLALALTGPWIGRQLVRFTVTVLEAIPRVT